MERFRVLKLSPVQNIGGSESIRLKPMEEHGEKPPEPATSAHLQLRWGTLVSSWLLSSNSSSEKLMWRQVSLRGQEKGGGRSQVLEREAPPSVGDDSDDDGTASPLSSRGLPQPLDAVKNVPRSPNRSSSSRRGDSSDLVSERTPESSLVDEELLSPLLREWKSPEDRELGVTSGNETLLLRLGPTLLALTSAGVGAAVTSDPGETVLLALLRFTEGGGGSSLGIICLHLPGRKQSQPLATKYLFN